MVHFKIQSVNTFVISVHLENTPMTPLCPESRAPTAPVDGNNRDLVNPYVKLVTKVNTKTVPVRPIAKNAKQDSTKIKQEKTLHVRSAQQGFLRI